MDLVLLLVKGQQALCYAMVRVILSYGPYAASTYHGSQQHKLLCYKAVHVVQMKR